MDDATHTPTEDIGDLLVRKGVLQRAGVERARHAQAETGESLDIVIVKLGLTTEQTIAATLSEELGLGMAGPEDLPDSPPYLEKLNLRFLQHHRLLPLRDADGKLMLAMANPLDAYSVEAVHLATGLEITPYVALSSDIRSALDKLQASEHGDVEPHLGEATEADLRRLRDLANEAPVIRLVNKLIEGAIEQQASDLHIEPQATMLRVRHRVDGIMRDADAPPIHLAPAIISRLKIMAHLNIAEHRIPQDGRIRTSVRGRDIDIRISTIPGLHGEGAALRLLDKDQASRKLNELGFAPESLARLDSLLKRPNGIILVTGPTGSGKTTTVYAALASLNDASVKILTVEDPIEYQIDGVHQVQVKPEIGLTFATALRAFLRHDPDIMMVGEIRDLETARIAVQSALTGHQVLSTLHTNDAASAVTRLIDMGIEDFLLTSTLNGVVAQRLVRTLCPHCRQPHESLPEYASRLGLDKLCAGEPTLWQAVGCAHCNGTGYKGRTAIIEVMLMTDDVAHQVLNGADANGLTETAKADGMRTLFEDGALKALAGETTLEEVLRVSRSEQT